MPLQEHTAMIVDYHELIFLGEINQGERSGNGPYIAQAINRYAYAINNPLNLVDPTGHSFEEDVNDSELPDEFWVAEFYKKHYYMVSGIYDFDVENNVDTWTLPPMMQYRLLLTLMGVPPDEIEISLERIQDELSGMMGDAIIEGAGKAIPYIGIPISAIGVWGDINKAKNDAKVQTFMMNLVLAMGVNGADMRNLILIVQHFEVNGTSYVSLSFQTTNGRTIEAGVMTYMQFRPIEGALWNAAEAHWKSPTF